MDPTHKVQANPTPSADGAIARDLEIRRVAWRYGVAVASTALTLALRFALTPWVGERPLLILFCFPIILSAYVGGLWPGVLATVITVVGTKILLAPPLYALWFDRPFDVAQWTLMLALGVLVSIVTEALHRSRRRAQAAAQEAQAARDLVSRNERRFRAMIENGSESFVLLDGNRQCIYASPAVSNVEGFSQDEIIGHNGAEHTHPDDALYMNNAMEQALANTGKPIPIQWRRRHKNGNWIWLEGVEVSMLDNPDIQAVVVNYRDISGRKHSEERVRQQLQHLNLLHQITRAMAQREDLASILKVMATRLEADLPVEFSCVCLFDQASNALQVAQIGERSAAIADELGIALNSQIPAEGLALGLRGVLVYEPDIARLNLPFPQALAKAGLRSVVVGPLEVDGKVMGLLLLARRGTNHFAAAECEFIQQLCEHVALAARQSQLHAAALRHAYDELRTRLNV